MLDNILPSFPSPCHTVKSVPLGVFKRGLVEPGPVGPILHHRDVVPLDLAADVKEAFDEFLDAEQPGLPGGVVAAPLEGHQRLQSRGLGDAHLLFKLPGRSLRQGAERAGCHGFILLHRLGPIVAANAG